MCMNKELHRHCAVSSKLFCTPAVAVDDTFHASTCYFQTTNGGLAQDSRTIFTTSKSSGTVGVFLISILTMCMCIFYP